MCIKQIMDKNMLGIDLYNIFNILAVIGLEILLIIETRNKIMKNSLAGGL